MKINHKEKMLRLAKRSLVMATLTMESVLDGLLILFAAILVALLCVVGVPFLLLVAFIVDVRLAILDWEEAD